MKTIKLLALIMVVSFTASSQKHKATKTEADYYNKYSILYAAVPEKFLGGNMDDFGARPGDTSEGDNMENCKTVDCYMLIATCTYGPPMNDAGFQSLRKEREAIKGTDDASMDRKSAISYREYNQYHLSVKLMANFISGEQFAYCKAGGYQKLTPPPGWDGWYMGSLLNCPGVSGAQDADTNFIFMGPAPTVKEIAEEGYYLGKPAFPINPADVSQFKVKNVVLYIVGSKELVADFVRNMNTASLRALIQQ